jgi:hypothetical protein
VCLGASRVRLVWGLGRACLAHEVGKGLLVRKAADRLHQVRVGLPRMSLCITWSARQDLISRRHRLIHDIIYSYKTGFHDIPDSGAAHKPRTMSNLALLSFVYHWPRFPCLLRSLPLAVLLLQPRQPRLLTHSCLTRNNFTQIAPSPSTYQKA